MRVCLQCRYRTNPRLAGVSSLVDTAANAHVPRLKLLSLRATERKGGLNCSQHTWEWLALPSPYALHSPSRSFSFLHSDEPELLILQLRHCLHGWPKCQWHWLGKYSSPVAPIFPQFHVTICLLVTLHGTRSSVKVPLKDNHPKTKRSLAGQRFHLLHLRHRTINAPHWICVCIRTM